MSAAADLLSLVLSLRPLPAAADDVPPADAAGRPMPRWWGRAAHTLLLQVVDQQDPALARSLHEENELRPFSASTLMGRFAHGSPVSDQTYTLRFTALTAPLTELLLAAAEPGGSLSPGAMVTLDYLPFQISAAASRAEEHPWAALASYQELFTAHLLVSAAPRRVSLQLASPLTFRSAGRSQPLPLPELVFGSLLERWNSFAPAALPLEVRRYAAECLNISRFKLRSQAVALKEGGLRIGSVGEVTYTSANFDRYWMSLVNGLAAFAQFSGVGAGISAGLGQCRRMENLSTETD